MRVLKSERKESKDTMTYQVTLEFSGIEGSGLRPGNYTGPNVAAEERERLEQAAGKLVIGALAVLIQ